MDAIQDLDLITTVDLSYTGDGIKPVYHFIYASQLYGTLFAVYANFVGTNNGPNFEITKITMRLINYKGLVNIGFTDDISLRGKDFNAGDALMEVNEINFGVRAASKVVEKILPLAAPIILINGISIPLVFNRTLYPMQEFQSFQTRSAGNLGEEPPLTDMFDTEFYERDGVDFYKHAPKEGMEGHIPPALGTFFIGPRCRASNVTLRFQ
jgi:hypothetical protein